MRWATYRSDLDGQDHAALVVDGQLNALPGPNALIDLIGGDREALSAAAERALDSPFEVRPLDQVDLRPPIPRPPSVRDFMAFENHYRDTREGLGLKVDPVYYEQPVFYFSNPAATIGPKADVPIAPGTRKFDFELEAAAVIGRAGRNLSLAEAEQHIAGYTILCDWSARDLQAKSAAMGTGPTKGKDTATSLGPLLVTPDELEPYRTDQGFDLTMTASVNGEQWSAGNWKTMYWSIAQLLVFASRGTELVPGDVIGTGTVGTGSIMELAAVHGEARFPWLQIGDEVVLEVEQLGEIVGRIVSGDEVRPLR